MGQANGSPVPRPAGLTALGLVVPLFDEAVRFAEYGDQLVDYVARQPAGSELLFVDDGSGDDTARLVEQLIAQRSDATVRLLRRPHAGKGAAVAAGLAATAAELVAFCDLDLSTPLDQLDIVVAAATRGAPLAIGSRDLTGSRLLRRENRVRESLGRAYNRLLQATVTPGIVDTQCGAKAARREVWQRILPLCRQSGFAWDAEVVAVALALGVRVAEIPIEWRHDDRSKIRVGRDGLEMVLETGRIWQSARAARPAAPNRRPAGGGEVFDGENAAALLRADGSHWWFRSKAALVATALRRTAGPASGNGLLIDVGAGGGGVTAMLGWPPDRIVAVDGAAVLVRHAHHVNGLPAARCGVAFLPLATASAEVVCMLDVIEHLSDPTAALAEARRVLRASGRLVMTVPAGERLWSAADESLGHHRRYRVSLLRADLAAAGFSPVLVTHAFSWLTPFVWFDRRKADADAPGLGLDRTSLWIDRSALVLTAIERLLLGRVRLPMGTSLLCVALPS